MFLNVSAVPIASWQMSLRIVAVLLGMLLPNAVSATEQFEDSIFFEGQFSVPQQDLLRAHAHRNPLFRGFASGSSCTASGRGYYASWRVENDEVFLVNLVMNPCAGARKEVPLTILFGQPAPVRAEWYSGDLIFPLKNKHGRNDYMFLTIFKGKVVSRYLIEEGPYPR